MRVRERGHGGRVSQEWDYIRSFSLFATAQEMDPHSRLSQFNHRPPKAGPPAQNVRALPMDRKKQTGPQKQQFDPSALLLAARPIVTNSRVKKNQKLYRDMYLVFVNSALERKSQVRVFFLRIRQLVDLRS